MIDSRSEQATTEECSPLIGEPEQAEALISQRSRDYDGHYGNVAPSITYRLYVSHFLSTWNSRVFEFGAVLYLATIYPGTLLPMSVYALSRGMAAIVFASAVGNYIDVGNRLQVVRLSIVLQRLVVAASCIVFYVLAVDTSKSQLVNLCLLAILTVLACTEKLCSILNMVSVEKDWVVVIAGDSHGDLRAMNAQMRRIDLVCKLLGPLFIALLDGVSAQTAIIVNFSMNLCSVVIEYYSIAKVAVQFISYLSREAFKGHLSYRLMQVYSEVPELQEPKDASVNQLRTPTQASSSLRAAWDSIRKSFGQSMKDITSYFNHHLFLPSFASALLYLTVLSFSGQMVTWLLSTGFDSTQVAVARTVAVAFEMLATWVAPFLMGRIGTVRAGLWLATWQIICLAGGFAIFWRFANRPTVSASGLVGGTILSRLGLRGFDLCAQILVQEGIEAGERGSFSSTEAAWQNLFEICSYISTIIFSRPDQFEWPALISIIAVTLAGIFYALYVRTQRGHLLHLPACLTPERLQRSGEGVLNRISSSSDM
ncbi:hypothetical protein N7539_005098 [Penicillium diatomitis]|uniref:Solute carrier family 40 member n=1 Tax=Penicillium diatomitis TaxID=2819901 RepID=A0A9W9X7I1_9EURO|nr:uncharacterized protein N7539_005098 [Penicillium diatomitis]KAJ5485110.1 hypothetical protein N7539_005098 [Penicillium diatomitis]